jgi:hypothetical protein
MDNPALNQQVKVLAVGAAGLLLAVFLGNQIGSENYADLILGAVVVVVSVAFFSGRFFWVLTIASSFLGGTFPILGGSFTPFQILMAIGVAKFLIEDVVLKRTRINVGNRFDALLIAGFMGVLTWHGIHDRFGMKFLGSSVWGGRNYVNVYVGLAAFFVIQSIPMKSKIWAKLPYVVLAVTTFDLIIAVITTIFPNSIYKIYPFYSAVSRAGIESIFSEDPDAMTGRIGAFGNFGFVIIVLVFASVSWRKLFHPSNFFRLMVLGAGSLSVLFSGFRSAVLNTLIAAVVACIRDLKWVILAVLPFLAFCLFGLSVLNSEFIRLPKQIQRSLTFVPGNWDAEMARDATASNEFRKRIWTLWAREYFPHHPVFGRGFGFQSSWAERSVYRNDPYADVQMVETGNIHNGFFSAVDCFGIIGAIFFVIWNVRLLVRTFRVSFQGNDPASVALRFLALYLAVSITSYWIGAQSVGTFLPQEFALAAVFLRLQQSTSGALAQSTPEQSAVHRLSERLVPV